MLGKMAGKSHQFLRQRHHLLQFRIGRIEAGTPRFLFLYASHRPAPKRAGERADGVIGKAEDLADLADGAATAIADDGGGHAGMIASISLVDVLDHLLAPLVLEIDIDVRWLAPLGGDEAVEQEARLFRGSTSVMPRQ